MSVDLHINRRSYTFFSSLKGFNPPVTEESARPPVIMILHSLVAREDSTSPSVLTKHALNERQNTLFAARPEYENSIFISLLFHLPLVIFMTLSGRPAIRFIFIDFREEIFYMDTLLYINHYTHPPRSSKLPADFLKRPPERIPKTDSWHM